MITKELGKISQIDIGSMDGRFGLWITLSGNGWGTTDTTNWTWSPSSVGITKNTKWTEEDRNEAMVLHDAKRKNLSELKGIPVEVEFENTMLKNFRILKEVL